MAYYITFRIINGVICSLMQLRLMMEYPIALKGVTVNSCT